MAYEIPSVAFAKGALPEIMEEGKSGLFVSGPEIDEIACAVKRILSNAQFARSLGQAARERIINNFTAEHMVEGTLKIYEQLLGNV